MTQPETKEFSVAILLIALLLSVLYYSIYNIQKRIDILSEKVKVLEDTVKSKNESHVYTFSVKQTI